MGSFKSNQNIQKKEEGSYYVVTICSRYRTIDFPSKTNSHHGLAVHFHTLVHKLECHCYKHNKYEFQVFDIQEISLTVVHCNAVLRKYHLNVI